VPNLLPKTNPKLLELSSRWKNSEIHVFLLYKLELFYIPEYLSYLFLLYKPMKTEALFLWQHLPMFKIPFNFPDGFESENLFKLPQYDLLFNNKLDRG